MLRDTATPLEFGRCLHNHLPIPSLKKHGTPISFPLILWVVSFHQCSASNFILLFVHLLPVGLVGVSNMFFFPRCFQEALLKVLSIEELQDFARAHAACCSLDDGPNSIKHGRHQGFSRFHGVVDRFLFKEKGCTFFLGV